MNVDEFLSLVKSSGSRDKGKGNSERRDRDRDTRNTNDGILGGGGKKRPKLQIPETEADIIPIKKSNLKKSSHPPIIPNLPIPPTSQPEISEEAVNSSKDGLEISDEERLRILQMVEDEPEGAPFDEVALKRTVSVLEKRIAKNQEMRIKFPDQPEKFMDSEVELHESIQELHALATASELYSVAVDLSLPSVLLGLLAHENADISCAILDLFQELTDVDTLNENEDITGLFLDSVLDQQAMALLTQNLDRLDESNKDESEAVHNTLGIFENLFEIRPQLCSTAGQNGLLTWLLKRVKSRIPFDANKLYAVELIAILLQDTVENRQVLGDLNGIDILLQQLATYKRHDPNTSEEAEYMENLFNCLCTALLCPANREKFLKGEGPQLMNLMIREKKQSRAGALKVLNHAVTGPDGASNANKIVEILGLRTLFPLFMKTPSKAKRKGISSLEHEEHIISIIAGLLQHLTGTNRGRVLAKFEENNFEKIERLGELHFKYLEKVNKVDRDIVDEMNSIGEKLDKDEIYLRRLDNGLFTLQLIDYIMLEVCVANPVIKEKLEKIVQLRRGSLNTIVEIVTEYSVNLGDENEEWKMKQAENIGKLVEHF